jgi:hypothetical protein
VKFGGVNLRLALVQKLGTYWDAHHEVGLRELWSWFARYVYLPRLRDVSVLEGAVRDGAGNILWRSETFAYAAAREEPAEYRGLVAGRVADTPITSTSLIVDGSVLPDPLAGPETKPSTGAGSTSGPEPGPGPGPLPPARVARFSGEAVLVDDCTPFPELEKLVKEIIWTVGDTARRHSDGSGGDRRPATRVPAASQIRQSGPSPRTPGRSACESSTSRRIDRDSAGNRLSAMVSAAWAKRAISHDFAGVAFSSGALVRLHMFPGSRFDRTDITSLIGSKLRHPGEGKRSLLPLRLSVGSVPCYLAYALVADPEQEPCVTRRVAGGADLRNCVSHGRGSGILRSAGAISLAKSRLDGLADSTKGVEIVLDDNVERVFGYLSHERDDLADHRLRVIEPTDLRV